MRYCGYEVSANVSLLFTELPYLDRFKAAALAGFDAVETWWPFATPVPAPTQVSALVDAIEAAGVQLTGLNFWAGDMSAGERGVASLPARESELTSNIPVVVDIADRTGCKAFNLLYGQIDVDDASAGRAQAVKMIQQTSAVVGDFGGVVLIEALAAGLNGTYPLHTVDDVLGVMTQSGDLDNVQLLLDTFHLASNGVDLVRAAQDAAGRIGHIQFADAPGRGEPGSGTLALTSIFDALRATSYAGSVAAEYKPTRATLDTLGWSQP